MAAILTHGRDPEPLHVVYSVDDSRMREFRLAPLPLHVPDRMDRQFVTLVVTDDPKTAVATFRPEPDNPELREPSARQHKT